MLTGIDHLVILVSELDEAIESYQQQGFTVVRGGRHPVGTHNALIGLADGSYLELLAFFEPKPQSRWWTKLSLGGGLIAVCLQASDLREEIGTMRSAGIDMSDLTPLSRVRPDGYLLKWVLSVCKQPDDLVPFLIEDETPRNERVPKEREHRNGSTGISAVTFAVNDLSAVRRLYGRVFRQQGELIEREELGASGVRFALGPHLLDFVAPRKSTGTLNAWLAARGPSPFSLTLSTASGGVVRPDIASTR